MPTGIPSYRYHKARDCAVVTIHGKDHCFGAFNSAESLEKYHRLIAESLRGEPRPTNPVEEASSANLTVSATILAYWRYVDLDTSWMDFPRWNLLAIRRDSLQKAIRERHSSRRVCPFA
jgi:hypothetical protein